MASTNLSRRRWLQLAAAGAGLGLAGALASRGARGESTPVDPADRKLLYVFGAYGGASIIDAFMPMADTEVGDAELASTLNVFPESLIDVRPGSNIRAVKRLSTGYAYYATPTYQIGDFLANHGQDVVVMAHEVSSVNHTVGQQRALSGAGLDRGRTILESSAMRYGLGLPLPACNMASDGFLRHGTDQTIPPEARHELITTPLLFGAGTHGYRAVEGAPSDAAIARARAVRSQLDRTSVFGRTFERDERLAKYLRSRDKLLPGLERASLMEKLLLLDRERIDPKFELGADPLVESLKAVLPRMSDDKMEAQLALGFLLGYHGVSTSIAMGYDLNPVVNEAGAIIGAPIAYDFSHTLHREVQSLMWSRTLKLVDTLITMLKTHDYLGDPALGKMWDRSVVYIATEFGREKVRPKGASSWGTSHHLNNGSVIVSPLLNGNRVYGGVDPQTCLTYGFDPVTGAPDRSIRYTEADVYSVLAGALELDVPNARAFPAIVRGA